MGLKGVEDLGDNEYLITNISHGVSKKGNKYAMIETINNLDQVKTGVWMYHGEIVPQMGWKIRGRWQDNFFKSEYK